MKAFRRPISLSFVVILLMAAFMLLRMFNDHRYSDPSRVIAWDVVSYYSYLPAAFIEHDLTLSFTEGEHTGTYWPETLTDGRKVIKTSMGLSFMYCPFFLVAHVAALLFDYPADGFSVPYAFALMLAGLVYCILGMLLLRRLLLRHFPEWVTALTLLIIGLCTNLYWYSVYEAPMSHAFSFCLFALFALLTEKWCERPTIWRSVAIGLTLGLISLVRPSNALVVVYFLLCGTHTVRTLRVAPVIGHYCLVAVAAAFVWVPQMAYWHLNTVNKRAILFHRPQDRGGAFQFPQRVACLHSRDALLVDRFGAALVSSSHSFLGYCGISSAQPLCGFFMVVLVVWRQLRYAGAYRELRPAGHPLGGMD